MKLFSSRKRKKIDFGDWSRSFHSRLEQEGWEVSDDPNLDIRISYPGGIIIIKLVRVFLHPGDIMDADYLRERIQDKEAISVSPILIVMEGNDSKLRQWARKCGVHIFACGEADAIMSYIRSIVSENEV